MNHIDPTPFLQDVIDTLQVYRDFEIDKGRPLSDIILERCPDGFVEHANIKTHSDKDTVCLLQQHNENKFLFREVIAKEIAGRKTQIVLFADFHAEQQLICMPSLYTLSDLSDVVKSRMISRYEVFKDHKGRMNF